MIWPILGQVTVVHLPTAITNTRFGACWKIAEVDFNIFIHHTVNFAFLLHTRNVVCVAKGPDPEQRLESFLQQNNFFFFLCKRLECAELINLRMLHCFVYFVRKA